MYKYNKNKMKVTNGITKMYKNINTETNRNILIGITSILIFLWLVLYLIPNFFVLLFNTFLGMLILAAITIFILSFNLKLGIILALSFIIIYRFSHMISNTSNKSSQKEGFTWSPEETNTFLSIQNTINRNINFDPKQLQLQASPEEVQYFNQNGMWPWSPEVIALYRNATLNNPYVRTFPFTEMIQARKIYNQQAILQILSLQTKEGIFLTSGVFINDPKEDQENALKSGLGSFGLNSGLYTRYDKLIKCGTDKDGNNVLQQKEYLGDGGILGEHNYKITTIEPENIENTIPNFRFINGPCNPCAALNNPPDYSCPFELKINDDGHNYQKVYNTGNKNNKNNKNNIINLTPDPVWSELWGLKSFPEQINKIKQENPENQNEFPIFQQIKSMLHL